MVAQGQVGHPSRRQPIPRPIAAATVGVVVLVVASLAAVLIFGPARVASYPPDSPEAAFQQFLRASDTGDLSTAYGLLSDRVRSDVSLSEFTDAANRWGHGGWSGARVTIERTDRAATYATLHFVVERFYEAGLRSSSYRSDQDVRLVLEGGAWKIDDRLIGIEPMLF